MNLNKIRYIVFSALILSGCSQNEPVSETKSEEPAKSEEKSSEVTLKEMDMYLIGGQSNAGGATLHHDMLDEVFKNVKYVGQVNLQYASRVASSDNTKSFYTYSNKVKAGYGEETTKIGPEYGMAKAINDLYSLENQAIIFKSAAGATSLVANSTVAFGTWLSRSRWEEGYDPNTTTTGIGFQYYAFVENFKKVYATLMENGYQPVVKGMAWMQGESDLGAHNLYKSALIDFINDIRKDIYDVTKNEDDLLMPFVIGKINHSFEVYNNPLVPPMNDVQQQVADSLKNVETIETSDFVVNDATGFKGSDRYHFNYQDMVTLGMRFANKILEIKGMKQ